jgi:diguanylate cyclase (GGDEF)-like protein/PAS domain S-box-containing protein
MLRTGCYALASLAAGPATIALLAGQMVSGSVRPPSPSAATSGRLRLQLAHLTSNRGLVLLTIVMAIAAPAFWLLPLTIREAPIPYYIPIHTTIELLTASIAIMVFAICASTHSSRSTGNLVILGCGFLISGCFDILHALSSVGMSDFISSNSPQKQLSFWLGARLVSALTLLHVALRPWTRLIAPSGRLWMIAGSVTTIMIGSWIIIDHLAWLPIWFVPGQGLSRAKIIVEQLTIIANLIGIFFILKSSESEKFVRKDILLIAVFAQTVSTIYFTNYVSLDRLNNLVGHLFKAISYFLIYRSIIVENLALPYRELARTQNELDMAVAASKTGLWSYLADSDDFMMSTALKEQLGYAPTELPDRRSAWLSLVHTDDRAAIEQLLAVNAGHAQGFEREIRVLAKDGDYRWILLRGRAGLDEQTGARRLIGSHIDVSARHREEGRFRSAVEASPTAMVMVDNNGVIVLANSKADTMFGYPPGGLLGNGIDMLVPPDRVAEHSEFRRAYLDHPIDRPMGEQRLIEAIRRDGHRFFVEIGLTTVASGDGRVVLASITDISDRIDAQQRIERLTNYDALTGLPNRALFSRLAAAGIENALADGRGGAMILMDIDNFKIVNDSLGHDIGDALLKAVSARLIAAVGKGGTVARIGGDDFVLLLQTGADGGLVEAISRVQAAVSDHYVIGPNDLFVTASMGISTFPFDGSAVEPLLQKSDIALGRAKAGGRNGYSLFTEKMDEGLGRLMKLDVGLYEALQRQQLRLVFQPQFAADGKTLVGAEALIRWIHPELGPVAPSEFIPIAERNGQIRQIGDWVLEESVRQLSAWHSAGAPPFTLAVNLSAAQFSDPQLASKVEKLLADAAFRPDALELELTETAAMADPEQAIAMADRLHKIGVRLAIDDFGTGYSSLAMLRRFKIHKLKIDKSFVDEVSTNDESRRIVSTIIRLAHDLGCMTVAEGVETEEQFEFLRDSSCDQFQGYLFGKPMEQTMFSKLLMAD